MHLFDLKIKGNNVWTNRSYFTVMIMSDYYIELITLEHYHQCDKQSVEEAHRSFENILIFPPAGKWYRQSFYCIPHALYSSAIRIPHTACLVNVALFSDILAPMRTSSTVYTCKIAFFFSIIDCKIVIFNWIDYCYTSIESQESSL